MSERPIVATVHAPARPIQPTGAGRRVSGMLGTMSGRSLGQRTVALDVVPEPTFTSVSGQDYGPEEPTSIRKVFKNKAVADRSAFCLGPSGTRSGACGIARIAYDPVGVG